MDDTWNPVLDDAACAEALDSVCEIAQVLRDPAVRALEQNGAALPQGAAGMALFYAYVSEAGLPVDAAGELADELIDTAIEQLAQEPMGFGLHGGFAGVAWAVEHLTSEAEDGDTDPAAAAEPDPTRAGGTPETTASAEHDEEGEGDDLNTDIDEAILQLLTAEQWHGDYDLISGLVGLAVYGFERMPHAGGRALLSEIARHLSALARRDEHGVTWFTAPNLLPEHQRKEYPDGYYNLGLAHGIPGCLAVLAQLIEHDIAVDESRALLDGALGWMAARRQDFTVGSAYPWVFYPGDTPSPSRHAWCYGDPGVAAALAVAGRVGERPDALSAARELALNASRASDERTGVNDAGLCHGSIGLSLIYARLAQATRDDELARAAAHWARYTLEHRQPGAGIAGYLTRMPYLDRVAFEGTPGLLTGACGVGLGLLAAATDIPPAWDRCLLLSAAPGARLGPQVP